MKNKFKVLLILGTAAALPACSGGGNPGSEKDLLADTSGQAKIQVTREVIDEMIQSLPQPIEIANIIHQSGMEFSKEMLVPSENSTGYPDKYYQSMAFGAYGVDLGYINLHEKNLYAIDYLESIQDLAKEIKVDQFFDFFALSEIAKSRNDADSMISISTKNFNKIDNFLRNQNRGELSVLILIGAWMEGMHMLGEIHGHTQSKDIEMRIGEQKVVFDNIVLITEKLSKIPHFKQLGTDMQDLKLAYSEVAISYVYKQPETKEVNGELVIIDKTETNVTITPETLNKLTKAIQSIRNKYLLSSIKK